MTIGDLSLLGRIQPSTFPLCSTDACGASMATGHAEPHPHNSYALLLHSPIRRRDKPLAGWLATQPDEFATNRHECCGRTDLATTDRDCDHQEEATPQSSSAATVELQTSNDRLTSGARFPGRAPRNSGVMGDGTGGSASRVHTTQTEPEPPVPAESAGTGSVRAGRDGAAAKTPSSGIPGRNVAFRCRSDPGRSLRCSGSTPGQADCPHSIAR